MAYAALQRITSAMVIDAPAPTTTMPCCALVDPSVVWDKNFLDGYEGEPGFSRRTRFLTIVGSAAAAWGVIIALGAAIIAH